MPLERIPNQPISFYPQDECVSTGSDFFQLKKTGDNISFQFKLGDCCNPRDIVLNGSFADGADEWVLNDGWSIYDTVGKKGACYAGSAGYGVGGTISQVITVLPGTYTYKVRFEIFNYEAGSIDFNIGFYTYMTVAADGFYEFYMQQTFVGMGTIFMNFDPTENFIGCIDNISVESCSADNYIVTIFTADGTYAGEQKAINDDGTFNSTYFDYYKDFVTFNSPLEGLEDGCYYICIKEVCECYSGEDTLQISTCEEDNLWLEGQGIAIFYYYERPECGLIFSAPNPLPSGSSQTITTRENPLCLGGDYSIVIAIESATTSRFRVICGTFTSEWIIASFGIEIINIIDCDDTNFTIEGESTSIGGEFVVETVSIIFNGFNNSTTYDYCSQPFQVYSDDSQFCTQLLKGCNNSDAFGFGFSDPVFGNSNFAPESRVMAKLFPGNYNQKLSIEENSLGKRSVKYAQSRKAKRLRIIDTAEYLWDWIAVWIGLDKMSIGNVDYVIEDDALSEVNYNKFQTLGTGDIQVGIKTQNMYKTNCATDENCEP